MPSKRRFAPQTRAFNERGIGRSLGYWGKGLVVDQARTPQGALKHLDNARDKKTEIVGRRGSFLYSPADYSFELTIDEDITTSFTSGTVYNAMGGNVETDKILMAYTNKDFTGGELLTAKKAVLIDNSDVLPYDLFKITDITGGVEYLGNIGLPKVHTNIDCTKNGHYITTQNGTHTFTEDDTGSYFSINGRAFFIEKVLDFGTVYTANSDINYHYPTIASHCTISYPIYASCYSQNLGKLFALIGNKIYIGNIPFMGWEEVYGSSDVPPLEAESIFSEVKDGVLLSNHNGIYRVQVSVNGNYYWKINSDNQNRRASDTGTKVWGFKSSIIPEGYVLVGFPGLNNSGERAGGELYWNGQIGVING